MSKPLPITSADAILLENISTLRPVTQNLTYHEDRRQIKETGRIQRHFIVSGLPPKAPSLSFALGSFIKRPCQNGNPTQDAMPLNHASTKVSGYSCAFQYAHQCLMIQSQKGSASPSTQSCRSRWPSKLHALRPINKARSAIQCLHAQLPVTLISSSTLGMLLLGSKLLRGIRISVLLLRRHEPCKMLT